MVLIRQTSGRRLALSFSQVRRWQGPTVQVARLDQSGWSREIGSWTEGHDDERLSEFLSAVATLPRAEAEEIAKLGLDEWQEHGDGQRAAGRLQFYGVGLIAGGVIIVGVALLIIEVF